MSTNFLNEQFMHRSLTLAMNARPHPNPYVGAVIVDSKEKVIAEGFHEGPGKDHAEVVAIKELPKHIKRETLTLYVNFEPCCHFGRTPPCTDLIIRSGIRKVIIGVKDPSQKVNGKGIKMLRKAGIKVTAGILKKDSERVNEQFITFHKKQRPFIALKLAATLDGKIATRSGDSKWITGVDAREYARRHLRTRYQALLVGINTVLRDDPHLGVRARGKRDPLRIIVDSRLRIPPQSQVLRDKNVIIATTKKASETKMREFERKGYRVWMCSSSEDNRVSISHLIERCWREEIISIFIEGGGKISSTFLNKGFIDKIHWFIAPKFLGDEQSVSAFQGRSTVSMNHAFVLKDIFLRTFKKDLLLEGYL